jgi:hypothetical protein
MGFDQRRAKLGKITTPNGAGGNNAPQIIDGTARSIGPLEEGWYTIEGTVPFYVLQVKEADVVTVDTTFLTNKGLLVPTSTEVEFSVDTLSKDFYIVWTKSGSNGTLRLNTRSKSGV